VSNDLIGATPLLPAKTLRHSSSAALPIGVIAPSPVTTTRRLLIEEA